MRQSEDKNVDPDPGCHPMHPFRAVQINPTSGIAVGNCRSAAQDCRNKTAGLRLSANLHRRTGKRPADHRRHAAVRPQTDIFSALDRSWQGVNWWYRSSYPGCPSVSSSRESADCCCCAVKIAFNSSAVFWSLEVANDTEGISMAADKTAANVLLAGIVLLRKFIGPPVWRILGIRCIVSS